MLVEKMVLPLHLPFITEDGFAFTRPEVAFEDMKKAYARSAARCC